MGRAINTATITKIVSLHRNTCLRRLQDPNSMIRDRIPGRKNCGNSSGTSGGKNTAISFWLLITRFWSDIIKSTRNPKQETRNKKPATRNPKPATRNKGPMNWTNKAFDALTPGELYAILQLRSEVFVVEQNCVFQDMDNKDALCHHLMCWEKEKLMAYARIVP